MLLGHGSRSNKVRSQQFHFLREHEQNNIKKLLRGDKLGFEVGTLTRRNIYKFFMLD